MFDGGLPASTSHRMIDIASHHDGVPPSEASRMIQNPAANAVPRRE
jgi:hypothetical protein